MRHAMQWAVAAACAALLSAGAVAQDWPQWRGPNRDARASGFKAPSAWPKELARKWKVNVGDGVATPALVGDRLYVFTREQKSEVIRCLDAATGEEKWKDSYEAQGATGPAGSFAGPRCSPLVADGKVVTIGVRGTVSCLDAATGKKLWRKDDFKAWPMFFTSSSPLVVGSQCVAQLGGRNDGAVVAYDLASGEQKWKWAGDGTAYASPALVSFPDGDPLIVVETDRRIVGLDPKGTKAWETAFAVKGRGYNASTPVVDGQTLIYSGSGRGVKAVRLERKGKDVTAKELWSNPDLSVQFNSPVLKDGLLYGISDRDRLFCINMKDGKTAWSAASGGRRSYGSVVDAGPVLLALTPAAQLIVFEPSAREFKEIARYKVADSDTYAYPVVAGNRVFVKDKNSLALWEIN